MKRILSILRITGLLVLAFILVELTVETGEQSVYDAYPVIWMFFWSDPGHRNSYRSFGGCSGKDFIYVFKTRGQGQV